MRDDHGSPVRVSIASRRVASTALSVALALGTGSGARASSFHGTAEVQYQTVDRSRALPTQDSWSKVFQLDYASVLPGSIGFTSSARFAEQSIARQSYRARVPEGSVRLTHRNFGLSSSYRPSETRDDRNLTSRQKDLSFTAYAQQDKLPRLSASWIRSRLDPVSGAPATGTVTRSIATQYALPFVMLRAGYGDRLLEEAARSDSRIVENHASLGGTSAFQMGRAPISLQYDFSRARAYALSDRSQLSHAHVGSATTSFPITARAGASLQYSYRRTQILSRASSTQQDHNGGASVSYAFHPSFQLSSGAGVRTAFLPGGRSLTERFVAATALAQGQARAGLRLSASATHSVNWLPDGDARPADQIQTSTSMRLTRGLDLRGDFSIATSRPIAGSSDTIASPRQVAVQSGVGLSAAPLRTVFLDANVSKTRAGRSITSGGIDATSWSSGLRLTPAPTMQLLGRWGLTESAGSRSVTGQASFQWSVGSSFQLSGGYHRARRESFFLAPSALQESLTGSMGFRLARELNAAVRYTESNRGQPNRVRQLTVDLVRRFGS
jgi:hypothetical protein